MYQSRTLFLGQAPGRQFVDHHCAPPLHGLIVKRLAPLMDISPTEFLLRFGTANLLAHYQGKQGKGDAFPLTLARQMAATFDPSPWHRIVMLGKGVAQAFGLKTEYFLWQPLSPTTIACPFPHPSGINRWWNDPANKAVAASVLINLLKSVSNQVPQTEKRIATSIQSFSIVGLTTAKAS